MEYFTRLLKSLRDSKFKFQPRCHKQQIIQLSFADDLLLFCRGDVQSTVLLYECFQQFSQASGLIADQAKSCVYFGGVSEQEQQLILQHTGFTKGNLPFRYLGVPLSSKKLSISQCQPLLDRMLGRINTWTVKFISYAGRLQLVHSVLTSIQAFWAQIFLLPKKVLQQVEAICKRFLWNGDTQTKGKALVAWDTICCPKVVGGLNITNVYVWNKAAILKYLWDLAKKKDKLWIVWVHTYYIKDRRPWEVQANQASWVVRKILQAGHWISEAGLQVTEVMEAETFAIKDMYKKFRGELSKVPWRRMICNNQGSPKWTFILYLAILRRLHTKDRLDKWGIHTNSICSLCKAEPEKHQHLFFACNMANVIWQRLLHWLSINIGSAGWNEELEWTTLHANRKTIQDEVHRMTLVAAVYYIWQERNYRIFQQREQRERTIEEITK